MATVVPPVALGTVTRERSVSPGKKVSAAIFAAEPSGSVYGLASGCTAWSDRVQPRVEFMRVWHERSSVANGCLHARSSAQLRPPWAGWWSRHAEWLGGAARSVGEETDQSDLRKIAPRTSVYIILRHTELARMRTTLCTERRGVRPRSISKKDDGWGRAEEEERHCLYGPD